LKKGDFFWLVSLAAFISILVIPVTREMFVKFTTEHAYLGGFIKFFIPGRIYQIFHSGYNGRAFSYKNCNKGLEYSKGIAV